MNVAISKLLRKEPDLPSPPAIALRILEEIKREECSIDSLSRIIEADPVLVAKVLRISNSSHYGLVSEVNTLPHALSLLGLNAVKNIVLSFVLTENVPKGANDGAFNYDQFWRRSVTTAVSADLVCDLFDADCPDIFVTALLQDIGQLFMYICLRDDYLCLMEESQFGMSPEQDLEKETLSYNHQEVSATVLENWGLPKTIYKPIGFHHTPHEAPEKWRFTAEILYIADHLSLIYHGQQNASAMESIKNILHERHGISNQQVDELIDRTASDTLELLSFFDIPPGNMKPFSQILQEANSELGKLNLTYEQLILNYKTAKDSAEKLLRQLQKANRKLRKLATTDGLTGLLNHRAFQEVLDRRISESKRHHRHLSLMLLDIDKFKAVNDQYGHPVGDTVLIIVSRAISEILRKEDIIARYGGEEYSIILPETDAQGAVHLAERIRKSIEDLVIKINGLSLKVTISIGVSTKKPHMSDCNKTELITMADKALYAAKNAGRNRVRASLDNLAVSNRVA